ncbi:hypothetical protein OG741_02100 [Streptomyces sp. NBC_01410]|uniref:RNA polymerase sigma factor n=1 Tax=Streptomyces sp. NBC_01410 TaxID=2903856 RepID=UPI003249D64F
MVDHQDEPPTDVELVAAALRNPGSDAAVEELYRRHREPVLSYAYTCRRDPRSTEDPTSEAFARAVRDARSGCGPTVRPGCSRLRNGAGGERIDHHSGIQRLHHNVVNIAVAMGPCRTTGEGQLFRIDPLSGTSGDGSCLLRAELRAVEPARDAARHAHLPLLRRRTALLPRRRPGTRIGRTLVHLRQRVVVTH